MAKIQITETELKQIIRESVEEVLMRGFLTRANNARRAYIMQKKYDKTGQQGYLDAANTYNDAIQRDKQMNAERKAIRDQNRANRAAARAQKIYNRQFGGQQTMVQPNAVSGSIQHKHGPLPLNPEDIPKPPRDNTAVNIVNQ